MSVIGFNGGVVGPDNTPTRGAASGVWTLDEQFLARAGNRWPLISYRELVLADGAIGFWLLDETSGSTAADSSGSYDLTYRNSPTLGATGPAGIGAAVTFNGTNQNAKGDDVAVLATSASASWSIECWVKWTTTSTVQTFMTVRNAATSPFITTGILIANRSTAGTMTLLTTDASGNAIEITGGTGLNDGNWHHVVGTAASGGAITLYVDGSSVASSSTARNTTSSNRSVTLASNRGGVDTYSQFANVSLAAAAYYNLTLTSTQVSDHYNVGS